MDKQIHDLVKFADILENNKFYEESQGVDLFVSYLFQPMSKEASREILNSALDFISKIFQSKNPKIRKRLEQLIKENHKPQIIKEPSSVLDNLRHQWNLEEIPQKAKDYTGNIFKD